MEQRQRIVWYAFLNWLILFFLYGLTITMAGPSVVPFVLTLAHLGVVPMLTHHYIRKTEDDRIKEAWKAGLAFAIIGIALDAFGYGYYLGRGTTLFEEKMIYVYFAMRLFLAPITAKWLEPHMNPA